MIAKKTVLFVLLGISSTTSSKFPPQLIQLFLLPTFFLFFFLECPVEASQFIFTEWQMGEG
jgi:hypothetical protein